MYFVSQNAQKRVCGRSTAETLVREPTSSQTPYPDL